MTIHDTDVALTEAAPSEDATQSIHAWSQTDDADTELVITHQRSWKLPVTCAIVALATIGAVGITLGRPHHAATPAKAAPAPQVIVPAPAPAVPETPDQKFVALFKSRGGLVEPSRESMVIDEAHQVCTRLTQEDENQLIVDMLAGTPGMSRYTAELFANAAIDTYCPQYSN